MIRAMFRWILGYVQKNARLRQVMTLVSGQAFGYLIYAALFPVLTSLCTEADFGSLAIYTALLMTLGLFATMRYDSAIPLAKSPSAAAALFSFSTKLSVLVGLTMLVAGRLIPLEWWERVRLEKLAPFSDVLALNVTFFGFSQTLTYWAVRHDAFRPLAHMRFTLSAGVSIAQVLLAGLWQPHSSLVYGQFIGYSVASIAMMLYLRHDWSAMFRYQRHETLEVIREFDAFPKYSVPAEFTYVLSVTLPPLLLNMTYDAKVVGQFMVAWRAVATPMTLLVAPITRVYLSAASEAYRRGPHELRTLFWSTAKQGIAVSFIPLCLLAIVAPFLFKIVFGERWEVAGYYCRYMTPLLACHLVSVSLRPTFDVIHRQSLHMVSSALGLALIVGGIVIPAHYNADPGITIAAFGLAGSLSHILVFSFAALALKASTKTEVVSDALPAPDVATPE